MRPRSKDPQWESVRQRLRGVVVREGAGVVARKIPAHRSTVYRMLNGQSRRPFPALFVAVERIVADATKKDESAR